MRNLFILILALVFGLSSLSSQAQTREQVKPLFLQKTFRFAGGICYIQQYPDNPTTVTFKTSSGEFLNKEAVEECTRIATNNRWEKIFTQPSPLLVDSFFEARAKNLSCRIVVPLGRPIFYQLTFYDIRLTDGDEGILECFKKARAVLDETQKRSGKDDA